MTCVAIYAKMRFGAMQGEHHTIIEGFAAPAPAAPPREIAFLAAYGAPMDSLLRAGEIAQAIGVSPDMALLGEGLAQEEFFYRALADRLGAPFHVGGAPLDNTVSPARALNAGLVYLARLAAPYRAIAAPRGEALRLLIDMADEGRAPRASPSPRRAGSARWCASSAGRRSPRAPRRIWSGSIPPIARAAR